MLFNSFSFLLLFLPVTLAGFFALAQRGARPAVIWLTFASLFFYAWWDYRCLPLLAGSILFNYLMARKLVCAATPGSRRAWLVAALAANLLLLGYFKYATLFVSSVAALVGIGNWQAPAIMLPIGISFFTFTQIAFLVDACQGKARPGRLHDYALFVSYFPHLIAGPLLHHAQMMPQFARAGQPRSGCVPAADFAVGLSYFFIGLAKKVLLADRLAPHADSLFNSAEPATVLLAWGGVLAYSLQLYFDFSAYSDMAIGISRLFGIDLPLNFDSPYKSRNISQFWRRWHMTLSQFLRDYLYIPLGGNRSGTARRQANLMLTMLLGGLWHGAGWNFVVWGGLHGLFLMLHQGWSHLLPAAHRSSRAGTVAATTVTFLAVTLAWVFFRAPDLAAALRILSDLGGASGLALPETIANHLGPLKDLLAQAGCSFFFGGGERFIGTWGWVAVGLLVAFGMPNTRQIMAGASSGITRWRATPAWAVAIGLLASASLLSLTAPTPFLYFQF